MLRPTISADDKDCLERARFLVSLGWDLSSRNAAGETAIHVVAREGEIPTLKYLLAQNVPLPTDVLLVAVVPSDKYRNFPVPLIGSLINEGANVNATAPNGDTPLHLTLRYILPPEMDNNLSHEAFWRVIEILLDGGADPSARNADGETPFDIAKGRSHFFKENFLRLVRNSEV